MLNSPLNLRKSPPKRHKTSDGISKLSVRKDLFGVSDDHVNKAPNSNEKSPLKSIWGETTSSTATQPSTNSILLSPALKRSPNRFSTACPSPKKSPGTPKRKLGKYSPFRKKVYSPGSGENIKRFFSVKEHKGNLHGRNKSQEVRSSSSPLSVVSSNFEPLIIKTQPNPSTQNTESNFYEIDLTQENSSEEQINSEKTEETQTETTTLTNNSPYRATPKNAPYRAIPKNSPYRATPHNSPCIATATKLTSISTPERNSSTPQSAKKISPNSKVTHGPNDVYGSFLLRILIDVMVNEMDPNRVKLFSPDEIQQIQTFNTFNTSVQRLYGRLLNRKLNWIRTSTMKYGDVVLELLLLEQNGFITSDCTGESLEVLLNLLTVKEVKDICKSFKIPDGGRIKSDLILKLMRRAKQPSIKSFFTKGKQNDSSGETNLRTKIHEMLGPAIKVVSGPQRTLARCLLYFSYPHFWGLERDRFSDQLSLVGQLRNNLTFPEYEVVRTTVFCSREQFLRYEIALIESSALLEAKEDKQWIVALEKLRIIVVKLKSCLESEEYRFELEVLPGFLRKFTALSVYVRAASAGVDVFKREQNTLAEAEACLNLLLSQRLYCKPKRGVWYEQLALLYQHNLKDNVKATETVLRALRDEYIDEVSRHTLCARAAMLQGRKKNGLKDCLKDALATQRALVDNLEEPPSITITQQILNRGKPGLKQVYIQDTEEDGKMLSSVEEVAREHFKQEGYSHGVHDEGAIIKSIILACFWNEIYGESVAEGHGLFHSEYQTSPLDWNSESFYDRRKEKLKDKLQDLAEGGIDAVLTFFVDCYQKNFGKESVVNWKYLESFELIEGFIKCIDIDTFLQLSRLLLKHHRTYRAGFPDLTLWNPPENKCLFVEVKSPNDTLSVKQRLWLHQLNKMGASALVCHVQSVGCKGLKRKASPTKDD